MTKKITSTNLDFLSGGGETGELIRSKDWSQTPLGPVESWPQNLRTCVQIMLASRQPIWLGWGQQLIKLYNDPYKQIVGGKHPNALGQPASVVWKDIWKDIGPLLNNAMDKGESSFQESQLLIMERNGYPEETYYTFSYTPISNEDGTRAGIICYNSDDTERIQIGRQLQTLTGLGKELIDGRSGAEVYQKAMQVLQQNPYDFPFACIYDFDPVSSSLHLAAATEENAEKFHPAFLSSSENPSLYECMVKAMNEGKPQLISSAEEKFGKLPSGSWPVSPDKVYVIPISESGMKEVYGFLVLGLHPYRLPDEKYRSFLELVADQVAMHLSDVYAFEKEKQRAEALSELDRAKTVFFSNISHEFRTPLTLMLSPMEEVLRTTELSADARLHLSVSLRNTKRLQKLVNTLLDFSRIEAGRMEANFHETEIDEITTDLVSSFRSAVEKAGMGLGVETTKFSSPVYVDTDMWEKIVLNLVSNAFKYTMKGSITVSVREKDDKLELKVKDTGIGIPAEELAKIFDRFHRVANAEGRKQEGSGIGLSLVKELVRLHGGTIDVESKIGEGSVFTVLIPLGKEHLPANSITSAERQLAVSVANHYDGSFDEESDTLSINHHSVKDHSILIADDNNDMRGYMQRLLSAGYRVVGVQNGEEAYEAAQNEKFDLIISDIMMPKLDGFGLLQKLKSNPATKNIPLIFLSARAGEEARIEGLEAGADDYLVKPFSARELIAKVDANIKIATSRSYAERNLYNLLMQVPAAISIYRGPDFIVELVNDRMLEFYGHSRESVLNKPFFEIFPELAVGGIFDLHRKVFETGERLIMREQLHQYYKSGNWYSGYFNTVLEPLRDLDGTISGMIVTSHEVTEEVMARKTIEANERKLNEILMKAPVAMAIHRGRDLVIELVNDKSLELVGRTRDELLNKPFFDLFPELKGLGYEETYLRVLDTGERYVSKESETVFMRNGRPHRGFFNTVMEPLYEMDGTVSGILIVTIEVTDQVLARKVAEQSEKELNVMANAMPQLVWIANTSGEMTYYNDRIFEYSGAVRTGDIWRWDQLVHPDDLADAKQVWQAAVDTGSVFSNEVRLQMKNGDYRWHLARANPQRDAQGKIAKWIGTATDIDEAKKLSQQKDEFMSIVSHELKTPVTSIKAFTQLLEQKFLIAGDETSSSLMRRMDNQINKLSTLISDLLDITKLDEGKIVFKNQIFSCIDLVNEVVEELQRTTSTHNIVKEFFVNCQLRGDRERVGQVLTNLISNAIKYSPQASQVIVRLQRQDDNIIFSVTDFGIGIHPGKQGRIFDRFYRVEGDTLETFPGLGLGLYISAEIVRRQHGRIWFESEYQKGSTFYFSLPIYTPQHDG